MLMTSFKVNEIEKLCLISRNCTYGDETFMIFKFYFHTLNIYLQRWGSEGLKFWVCWKYSATVTTYQFPQNTYHYRIYTSWIVSKQEPDNNTATVLVGYRVVVTTGTLHHVDTPEQLIPQWSDHVYNSTSNQQDWLSKLHKQYTLECRCVSTNFRIGDFW